MIKRIREYLRYEKELYEEHGTEVNVHNRKMLMTVLAVTLIGYLFLLILSVFSSNYSRISLVYFVSIVYYGLCLFFTLKFREMPVRLLNYGLMFVMVLFCMYSSAFITPHAVSVRILLYLLLFPMLFYDCSLYVDAAEVLLAVMYLGLVGVFKESQLVMDEIVNVCCYTLMALVLGHFIRWNSLRYFSISRAREEERWLDDRTGLFNYRRLAEDMKSRSNPPKAIAVIQIGGASRISRRYGEELAEAYFKRLGDCLQTLEQTDSLGCYCGSMELTVVLEHNFEQGLFQRLAEIYEQIRALEPGSFPEAEGQLDVRIGASLWRWDFQTTMGYADRALSYSIEHKENHIVIYEDIEKRIQVSQGGA